MRYTISGLECKHQQFELIEIFDFITQLEELKKKINDKERLNNFILLNLI